MAIWMLNQWRNWLPPTLKSVGIRPNDFIILHLNEIKENLLKPEQADIFEWQKINEHSIKLDRTIEKYEISKISARQKGEELQVLKEVIRHKKELEEAGMLENLDEKLRNLLEELKLIHNQLREKIDALLTLFRESKKLREDIIVISRKIENILDLIRRDNKVCNELKKNTYIRIKISDALGKDLFSVKKPASWLR